MLSIARAIFHVNRKCYYDACQTKCSDEGTEYLRYDWLDCLSIKLPAKSQLTNKPVTQRAVGHLLSDTYLHYEVLNV